VKIQVFARPPMFKDSRTIRTFKVSNLPSRFDPP
jgi:hypothetical protein